ncbi:MAG: adenylyltransferase / riboflavin kinase [Bryobacterales bacterium]|nr:adenylyltransferase / riboflavin kinase [Bryobacterales bacterium]
MKIIRSLDAAAEGTRGTVVTIGNYDGVHLGHQAILKRVVARAKELGLSPAVLTFDPHPARVLAPERAPQLISTTAQKLRRLEAAGIETVLLVAFSKEFAMLTPREFAEQVLRGALEARVVMTGEDFRFGNKQAGDIATLRELGQELGFEVEAISEVGLAGKRISSTMIRGLVSAGKVSRACRLMGTSFALEGPVVSGKGIGSKQTVPTLNLAAENELLPHNGVYITRTRLAPAGPAIPSITNIGYRPTFDGEGITVETFLLVDGPVEAPARIEVEFLSFVRHERKFATPEQLKARILYDVGTARRFHERFGYARVG